MFQRQRHHPVGGQVRVPFVLATGHTASPPNPQGLDLGSAFHDRK